MNQSIFPLFLSGYTLLLPGEPVVFPVSMELERGVLLESRDSTNKLVANLEWPMLGRFGPTHFIRVQGDEYTDEVRRRRGCEDTDFTTKEFDLAGAGLVRRLLLALSFAGYNYTACPSWRYWVELQEGEWEALPGADSSHLSNVLEEHRLKWDDDIFRKWFALLEPYYCPFKPVENRIAVALHSFWSALSADKDYQRTPSLMVACEALLSTDKTE